MLILKVLAAITEALANITLIVGCVIALGFAAYFVSKHVTCVDFVSKLCVIY